MCVCVLVCTCESEWVYVSVSVYSVSSEWRKGADRLEMTCIARGK